MRRCAKNFLGQIRSGSRELDRALQHAGVDTLRLSAEQSFAQTLQSFFEIAARKEARVKNSKFAIQNLKWLFGLLPLAVQAQSANDIPPLRPALREIPPTIWELYGVWIVLGIWLLWR